MPDPHVFDLLRLPAEMMISLDDRRFHFAMQPYHHLVRMAHVLTAATFFGGIVLLDLRLTGLRGTVPLRSFAEHTLPWLYVIFALCLASGTALFLYDPVHVASHAYFVPKLILLALGLLNALIFHRTGYVAALAAEARMPATARIAGALSLTLWLGVFVCACLNVEAAPKLLLR